MTKQDGKAILFMTCPILQIFVEQTVGEIGCLTRDGRGLVDPQFHICALADLWEYSLVYCECDMTVIQIPNRDEGCLTSDVSRRGKRGRNCDAGRGTWSPVSRAQRIWFVGPHPGPQVVTERPMCPHLMYYSLRPPKHRWSPIAKLETNVWWFS